MKANNIYILKRKIYLHIQLSNRYIFDMALYFLDLYEFLLYLRGNYLRNIFFLNLFAARYLVHLRRGALDNLYEKGIHFGDIGHYYWQRSYLIFIFNNGILPLFYMCDIFIRIVSKNEYLCYFNDLDN